MKLFGCLTPESKTEIVTEYKILIIVKKDSDFKVIETIEVDEKMMLEVYNKLKNTPRKEDGISYPRKVRFT